jgi:hypothetical protein
MGDTADSKPENRTVLHGALRVVHMAQNVPVGLVQAVSIKLKKTDSLILVTKPRILNPPPPAFGLSPHQTCAAFIVSPSSGCSYTSASAQLATPEGAPAPSGALPHPPPNVLPQAMNRDGSDRLSE